jgi:hypothetical protein
MEANMKIKERTTGARDYFVVLVDKDELQVESGKRLPYSTYIGTIQLDGKINLWTPAAYKPRGYPKAARELLEQARDQLKEEGKING